MGIDWKIESPYVCESPYIQKHLLDCVPGCHDKVPVKCPICDQTNFIKLRAHISFCRTGKEYKCSKCVKKSPEYRAKISGIIKNRWTNPNYAKLKSDNARQQWIGGREKLSAGISQSLLKKWTDPQYRKKMANAMSIRTKEMWLSPVYREHMQRVLQEEWERPGYREKMKVQSKDLWQNPEYRIKLAEAKANQPRFSKPHALVCSMLDEIGIRYEIEALVGYYLFDVRIDPQPMICLDSPLLIEVQGDYWHNLPSNARADKIKAAFIEKYYPGYVLKYIWEHELVDKGETFKLLQNWLGIG